MNLRQLIGYLLQIIMCSGGCDRMPDLSNTCQKCLVVLEEIIRTMRDLYITADTSL
jgi:hypothetical protein